MSHALQCKLFSLSCDYWMMALALLHPPHTFLLLLPNRQHGLSSSSSPLPALSCILLLLREMCTAVHTGKKWGWQRQRWNRSMSWVTDDTKLTKKKSLCAFLRVMRHSLRAKGLPGSCPLVSAGQGILHFQNSSWQKGGRWNIYL